MNIEAEVIQYLSGKFSAIPVYGEIPENRPKTMLVVDRTGGSVTNLHSSWTAMERAKRRHPY